MHSRYRDLIQHLDTLAQKAREGDRVPPIRDMMKQFGASQVVVQRALNELKDRGLIKSEVGRGTYFVRGSDGESLFAQGAAGPAPATAASAEGTVGASIGSSVLLLRRSVSVARGRRLTEGLQARFADEGARVLELSYTDAAHAKSVLRGLPRFDACVVQSTYRPIPMDLLAELRPKCGVLAVDGLALTGSDIEAVGQEWAEPLSAAVAALRAAQHRRIALATTSHPFLATQLARRRFERLAKGPDPIEAHEILLPLLPDEGFATGLVQQIQRDLNTHGTLPYTALVAWGIEDGKAFRAALASAGIEVPRMLSVVLLGRPDIESEHGEFFATFGSTVGDQIEALHRVVHDRLRSPQTAGSVTLTPVRHLAGASISRCPAPAGRKMQR